MTAPLPPDPADVLTRLEELHKAATPGPWTPATAPSEGSGETHAAAAHDHVPALLAAVRRVLALADDMDREMAERGFRLDRIELPGDRLRRALAGPDDARQDGAR